MRRVSPLLFVFMLWVSFSSAQTPVDMYRVEVPVANQSEPERIAAAKSNIGDVIVRAAGDAAALQHPLVKQAINDAPNYLSKYSYTADSKLILNFSPQAIRKLLVEAQLITAPTGTPQAVALSVEGVGDFVSFKQVQSYLKSFSVVRRVQLLRVDKDIMQMNLVVNGDVESLKSALNASDKLKPVAGAAENSLQFRWQNQ